MGLNASLGTGEALCGWRGVDLRTWRVDSEGGVEREVGAKEREGVA